MVVWDGMRPDFVSEENTPNLWKLSREGVTFRNHHSVYPSVTLVNGTALVTGVYPGRNGIIANHVYRSEIEFPPVVTKGDDISGGKYISVPTLAGIVRGAGGRTIVAAAKTVGLLLDRQIGQLSTDANRSASPRAEGETMNASGSDCITLYAAKSLPADFIDLLSKDLGPFPVAHLQDDTWTTKALTHALWKNGVPALSILWLGEPDLTQHETAPGAPDALGAIKSSDKNLGAVLETLDNRKMLSTTDVFVVSDHGFSTIARSIDLPKILKDAGFNAKTQFESEPKSGDIMLAGNGGSVLFYVVGHDQRVTRRLVEFLQQSDFAGVIFTEHPMPGTFGLDQAKIANLHAPDVVMAFRWNDSNNQFGVPGMIDADWQRAAGKGTHATLSRFDMHNVLIAAGPDFQRGQMDNLPSGNTDLAPTILHILGIKSPDKMDGRILSEAMTNAERSGAALKPEIKTTEAATDFASGRWRQSLKISRVGSTIYLDEGNGIFEQRK